MRGANRVLEPFAEAVRDRMVEHDEALATLRSDLDTARRELAEVQRALDLHRQLAGMAARIAALEVDRSGTGAKKPALSLVDHAASSSIEPPRPLGDHGRSLWDRVQSEFDLRDCAGIELLLLAAETADRVARIRERIDDDGETIKVRGVPKAHPALRDEIAARARRNGNGHSGAANANTPSWSRRQRR